MTLALVVMGVPPASDEMEMETVWPFSTSVVEPEMETKEASAASRKPSPSSSMETERDGAAVSLFADVEACVAELPAKSSTSAVMERLPSPREERSTPVAK